MFAKMIVGALISMSAMSAFATEIRINACRSITLSAPSIVIEEKEDRKLLSITAEIKENTFYTSKECLKEVLTKNVEQVKTELKVVKNEIVSYANDVWKKAKEIDISFMTQNKSDNDLDLVKEHFQSSILRVSLKIDQPKEEK